MTRQLQEYCNIIIKPELLDGRIDFVNVFGRYAPLHIEIGSGRGTFLVQEAKMLPEINFLGIEWASRYYRYTVDRVGRWGLKNVRMLRSDAAVFISEFVPDACVDCFHIYFPDPWPKKKHHKRRFICEKNLKQLLRCLKKDGIIRIATDHSGYFEQIERVLSAKSNCLQKVCFLPAAGASISELGDSTLSPQVGSNFERKYLKENRPIYTIAVQKTRIEDR